MEQVAAEAQSEGSPLGEIKRRIDGKGIVLFTLESGGMVRDTGKELFFSPHDPQAEYAAKRYAEKKWGKRLAVEKGHIRFQSECKKESQQQEPERPSIPNRRQGISR